MDSGCTQTVDTFVLTVRLSQQTDQIIRTTIIKCVVYMQKSLSFSLSLWYFNCCWKAQLITTYKTFTFTFIQEHSTYLMLTEKMFYSILFMIQLINLLKFMLPAKGNESALCIFHFISFQYVLSVKQKKSHRILFVDVMKEFEGEKKKK